MAASRSLESSRCSLPALLRCSSRRQQLPPSQIKTFPMRDDKTSPRFASVAKCPAPPACAEPRGPAPSPAEILRSRSYLPARPGPRFNKTC